MTHLNHLPLRGGIHHESDGDKARSLLTHAVAFAGGFFVAVILAINLTGGLR